jgi:hypothetical protein
MFFRPSKKRPISEELDPQAEKLRDWRHSAQKVTRAWNAWLAADGRDRAARYTDYAAALAAEELAAARVERMLGSRQTSAR